MVFYELVLGFLVSFSLEQRLACWEQHSKHFGAGIRAHKSGIIQLIRRRVLF